MGGQPNILGSLASEKVPVPTEQEAEWSWELIWTVSEKIKSLSPDWIRIPDSEDRRYSGSLPKWKHYWMCFRY
jgi:hypothetical protein